MQKPKEKRRDWGSRSFVEQWLDNFRLYHERRVIALQRRVITSGQHVIALEQRLRKSHRENTDLRAELYRLRAEVTPDRRAGGEE